MHKLFLSLVLLAAPLWAANIGFTGGETGDTSELSSSASLVLDTVVKKTDSYSYKVDATGDQGTFTFDSSNAEVFVACYFRTTEGLGSTGDFLEIRSGATVLAAARIVQSGTSTWRITAAGGTQATGSVTDDIDDTWVLVEIRYKKGTGSDSIAELRINGVVDATSNDGTNSTDDPGRFRFQDKRSGGFPSYFDDVRASNSAYPGAGVVTGVRPDAIGDEDNFTNGFAQIDDDPVDDATLREAPGSGSIPFLNDVEALASVGTINQARVKVRALRTNGGGREHYIRWLKPGGTAENSADLSLTGTVAFFSFTPSDQPTTQAHIDDMQAGMTQNTVGGRLAQCTEVWVMVDRTVAVGGTRQRGHVMD